MTKKKLSVKAQARKTAKELAEKMYVKKQEQENKFSKQIAEQVDTEFYDAHQPFTIIRRHILVALIDAGYVKGDTIISANKIAPLVKSSNIQVGECIQHLMMKGVLQRAVNGRSYEMKSPAAARRELNKYIRLLKKETDNLKRFM